VSIREASKELRRSAIVEAARALLREAGDAGFSMRALALKAGVSVATPYNLFGSKQQVMFALMTDDLIASRSDVDSLRGNEIDVFFQLVSLARTRYQQEPRYHRAILFAVFNDGGKQHRAIFGGPRHLVWKEMINAAVAAGYLRKEIDADAFAIILGHIFLSCVLEWANKQMSLSEFEVRVHYGLALALAGMATEKKRAALNKKILETQDNLLNIWQSIIKEALKSGPLEPSLENALADQLIKLRGNL